MKGYRIIGFLLILTISLFVFINVHLENEKPKAVKLDQERPEWSSDRHWHRVVRRGGTIDPNVITKARTDAKSHLKKTSSHRLKDGGIIDWNWRGPGNIGGRIRAIALQPNGAGGENIFIGAAGGGIWKSEDDGQTWSAIDDFAPSLAVTCIVVDPSDSNILYATTGEGQAVETMGIPGAGIFKSLDGGNSWAQLPSTATFMFYWVNRLAIDPFNNSHLIAVTADFTIEGAGAQGGRAFESFDGGASWSDIFGITNKLTDVDFHPTLQNRITISGRRKLFVYDPQFQTYTDKVGAIDGLTNYSGRIEVAMSPSNANILYAVQGTGDETTPAAIYKSIDGGATWPQRVFNDQIFSSPTLANYAGAIWVDPCNEDHVYIGGLDLWKSVDGAMTFSKISVWSEYHNFNNLGIAENSQLHADQHLIIPSLFYSCNNKKVYIGNDGGIQKTDNISTASTNTFGISGWDNLVGTSLGITQFYSVARSPVNGLLGGGAQDNGILLFDAYDPVSGDPKWRQPSTGDGSVVAFHPTDANIVYATVNYNKLIVSSDGGLTFSDTNAELGKPESRLIGPMTINSGDGNEVFLGGKRLWVYDRILQIDVPIKDSLPSGAYISTIVSSGNGMHIWLGYEDGTVQYTIDGAVTWSADITTTAMPNTCVTDIALDPFDQGHREALITFGGYNQSNIWKYGENETGIIEARSLDFNMQVNTVTYHPTVQDWIYIGTDVGVFASENEGLDWSITPLHDNDTAPEQSNEGPAFTEVTDLFWSYGSNEDGYALWAVTFGRGLWVTDDVLGFSGIVQDTIFFDPTSTITWRYGTRDAPYRFLDQAMFDRIGDTGSVIKFLGGGSNPISGGLVMDQRVVIVNEVGTVVFNIE